MKSDSQDPSGTTRRGFLGTSVGTMATLSLAGLGLAAGGSARADEYGILDQPAPELQCSCSTASSS